MGSFGVTYEGLKPPRYAWTGGTSATGFGVTYEGLKRGWGLYTCARRWCFGVTYEGLKPLDEHFRAHIRKQIKEVDTR